MLQYTPSTEKLHEIISETEFFFFLNSSFVVKLGSQPVNHAKLLNTIIPHSPIIPHSISTTMLHPITSSPLNFFLFLSLLSVAVVTTTSFADEFYHQPPFDCGPFKNLSYPFTLAVAELQSSHYGTPEFRLNNCDPTASPELTIPPLSYRVLRLNQTDKTLTLARSDLWNNTCLADQFTNSTILNSTILNYTTDNEDLTIYYGCFFNFTEMRILPTNLFNCSSIDEEISAAFYLTGPVPADPILNITTCHVGVTLKILKTAASQLTSKHASLREVLMEGFNATYSDCVSQPCPKSGIREFISKSVSFGLLD